MSQYEKSIPLWNAGYAKYINHYGDDNTPLLSARMSTQNPTGVDKAKDDSLRSFLWRHGHVSPFEQAGLTIEVQVPIFIARQFMRHKSLHVNEFSQRYSEPMHEYYVPEASYIKLDDKHNKQSSNGEVPQDIIEEFIIDAKSAGVLNKSIYNKYRRHGIAKERVRDFQPVTAYTRIMATANLRDWFFFLQKRLDAGAQMEIRDLSRAIYSILKELFPLCCEVFEEHTLKAKTFGNTELLVLRDFINNGNLHSYNFKMFCDKYGLSASRARELVEVLNIAFKY